MFSLPITGGLPLCRGSGNLWARLRVSDETSQMTRSRRAQVGIGTLVVFLAMVLVASIAAGVLLNTTGALQSQTGATGEQSSDQVLDRIQVVGQTGAGIQDGAVGLVNLTVTRGPDAEDVDLRSVTVTWVGPHGSYNVASDAAAGTAGEAAFAVTALSDPNDSLPVLDSSDDRMVLTFDLGSTDDEPGIGEFGHRLEPGEQANVLLTSESGASTRIRLAVPRSLSGKHAVVL